MSQTTTPVELAVTSQFDFLSKDYEALFEQSHATVFQTPFWLETFYRKIPASLKAEPVIITAHDEKTGELLFVLPLVRQRKFGTCILQPADLGISDYNSIIARADKLERLTKDGTIGDKIKHLMKPFDILLFRKQRSDSFDIQTLFHEINHSPNINSAFEMEISAPFEEWQRSVLSKSTRKGLTRKRRNFAKEIGPMTFRSLNASSEIEKAFVFLRQERAKRYPDDLLNVPTYFDFYLDIAVNQAESGKAITYIGEVGDRLVTVDFGLLHKGCHIMLLGAYSSDSTYHKYSPGLQAIMDIIRSRKDMGIDLFDFSIGDEEYKGSFGAQRISLDNAVLTNSLKGQLALSIYRKDSFVKALVKKLAPNVH